MADNDPARMALECAICGHRPPEDSVMEAVKLHFEVEHDTDDLRMNLSAICVCGATMRHTGSIKNGVNVKDLFVCDACSKPGAVYRTEGELPG